MRYAEHLGDGAYVHLDDSGGVMLTANHHDPLQATDKVYLDGYTVRELQKCMQNELNNWTGKAEKIIAEAKAALDAGVTGYNIDTSKMSEIGKAVIGAANDFSVSPEIRAASILKSGWFSFNSAPANEYASASAAQDLVAAAYDEMIGDGNL